MLSRELGPEPRDRTPMSDTSESQTRDAITADVRRALAAEEGGRRWLRRGIFVGVVAPIDPQVELKQVTRPEMGRLMGVYGSHDQPASLVLSSTAGRVVFGLMHE